MANDISGPTWVLDTTGTIIPSTRSVKVKSLRWLGATTAGHTCIIKDGGGRLRWKSIASGNNFLDVDAPGFTLQGFVLDTLASGELHVEVG